MPRTSRFIPRDLQSDADGARRMHVIARRIDELACADSGFDRHRLDFPGAQADHLPIILLRHEIRSVDAEARPENAVKRAGRSAALHVPEHGHAHFLVHRFANRISDRVGHLAGTRRGHRLSQRISRGQVGAFRDDHQAKIAARSFALLDRFADGFDAERNFGN
jgi:hypothetical protein